eukprot:scaffold41891_cov18-Tisochrysis_lutea.AAC.1
MLVDLCNDTQVDLCNDMQVDLCNMHAHITHGAPTRAGPDEEICAKAARVPWHGRLRPQVCGGQLQWAQMLIVCKERKTGSGRIERQGVEARGRDPLCARKRKESTRMEKKGLGRK